MTSFLFFKKDATWNLKSLIFCHLVAIFLISSLLLPYTKPYWDIIDTAFFKWINGSLTHYPHWQMFWALANHRLADWFEDACILLFFIAAVRQLPPPLRRRRIFELTYSVLCIALVIILINDLLFRQHLRIPRLSPTYVIDSSVHLAKSISWARIKGKSANSFPGDHATTAILFAASFCYIVRGRLAILACVYGAFLCIPRLIIGAHWLSDVVVGSGSIALIILSWAFSSPLLYRFVTLCESIYTQITSKVVWVYQKMKAILWKKTLM